MTLDELAAAIPEVPREKISANVSVAVCQGRLVRDGRGRGAKYGLPAT